MTMPVLSLPVVQQWDCHSCGECCRSYAIRVTELEKARIESQGWDLGLPGVVPDGRGGHQLNSLPDNTCVFLGPDSRCRIHAKFGAAGKPMACRIYPFSLVPAGDHWRVGIRMACPSAVKNAGRTLTVHKADFDEYAGLLEADAGGALRVNGQLVLTPPELVPGQSVPWSDLLRFTAALTDVMKDDSTPVDHRLRKMLAIAALCKKSRFDTINGTRLDEFLEIISAAVAEDVPLHGKDIPPPGWLGRMIFRQVAAIYARKDAGANPGIASRSRWTRIRAAWRFAMGRGRVPALHGQIPDTTFEAAEMPLGELPKECEELLQRYYLVKLESMQFCGATNFRRPFWTGLESLVLTYPAILWLTRVFAANATRPIPAAMQTAVQIVDDSFGFNPLLGTPRQTWAITTLADKGELTRLVAWYGRTTPSEAER
jgi:lysine-N-methylase